MGGGLSQGQAVRLHPSRRPQPGSQAWLAPPLAAVQILAPTQACLSCTTRHSTQRPQAAQPTLSTGLRAVGQGWGSAGLGREWGLGARPCTQVLPALWTLPHPPLPHPVASSPDCEDGVGGVFSLPTWQVPPGRCQLVAQKRPLWSGSRTGTSAGLNPSGPPMAGDKPRAGHPLHTLGGHRVDSGPVAWKGGAE